MSGHLPCTAMLPMFRHISTFNYLRSADTCLTRTRTVIYWLYVPVISGQYKQSHVLGGNFNPKSLAARTLICDRQFAQISILPSSDRKQYFISRVNVCLKVTLVLLHQVVKSHVFCVKPAMSKRRTIIDQCASCRTLAIELLRQTANSTNVVANRVATKSHRGGNKC